MVDTTRHLTSMAMVSGGEVRVTAGARMDDLLAFLHDHGKTITNAPAPGDVTVAGVLAVDGHGTSVPAVGEAPLPGRSFGTVSNLVTSVTAVVWSRERERYEERTFTFSSPECAALSVCLGKAFITEVRLRVHDDQYLRCRCHTDIHINELFAAPAEATPRSLSALLDRSGRVGVIWYAFTEHPWVQEWTVTPRKPVLSRPTDGPYNFPFADNLPSPVPELLGQLVAGHSHVAPAFGHAVLAATNAGLTARGARDMWGPAKDFLHFVKPTTLRVSAGSHVVVTSRSSVQRVVHEFTTFIRELLAAYRARDQYPINSCVEIRVTGVDEAGATLSAARAVDEHPEWDTAIWLDTLTLPGTPHEYEAFADIERFLLTNFRDIGVVRPEWAKRRRTAPGPIPWRSATTCPTWPPAGRRRGRCSNGSTRTGSSCTRSWRAPVSERPDHKAR